MYLLRRYDWTIHMAAIAVCAYFFAQSVTTYIAGLLESIPEGSELASLQPLKPQVSEGEQREAKGPEDYKIIADRNIFNSAQSATEGETAVGEAGPEQLGELGPAVKTSLEIKLLGTLVIGEGDDRRSSATVSGGKSGGKGEAEVYYPGDEKSFAPNVKLTKVEKDRIEFVNGGRLEFAELEDFASKKSVFASPEEVFGKRESLEKTEPTSTSVASEGGKIVVDQREIDDALQNLDRLMTEIRIVPNFQGGQPAGMKVLSVKPGSVISKLGIKRGDILEKVNGQDLDMKRGMELFSQMKDMKSFALDVVRGGKNQTLEYEIR